MTNLESLSLFWRVESRQFHLTASPASCAELSVDGQAGLALSPEEWCALGDVLFRIGMDWPTGRRGGPVVAAPPEAGEPAQTWPRNASVAEADKNRKGRPWTDNEETRVLLAFDAGDGVADIARALGRSRAGVLARLAKLGRVDAAEVGLRYPIARAEVARAVDAAPAVLPE